jgi:carbon storage regulator
MLVLTRKEGEKIRIGHTIELTVVTIHRNKVRLGVSAPWEVPMDREEVYRQIEAHHRKPSGNDQPKL